jgi:hypothetical protein
MLDSHQRHRHQQNQRRRRHRQQLQGIRLLVQGQGSRYQMPRLMRLIHKYL